MEFSWKNELPGDGRTGEQEGGLSVIGTGTYLTYVRNLRWLRHFNFRLFSLVKIKKKQYKKQLRLICIFYYILYVDII